MFILAVNGAVENTDTRFQHVHREIEAVGGTMAKTQQDISRLPKEVNNLARELVRARTDKQLRKLQERRNVVTKTLYSLVLAYKTLTVGKPTYQLRVICIRYILAAIACLSWNVTDLANTVKGPMELSMAPAADESPSICIPSCFGHFPPFNCSSNYLATFFLFSIIDP